jgi:hypothetical protein
VSAQGLERSRLRLAFERLGGKRLLGVEVRTDADFLKVLERGVPVSALAELTRQEALSPDDVDRLIIPRRTLAHRKAKSQPLNRAESERAVRVASVTALAEEAFARRRPGCAGQRRRSAANVRSICWTASRARAWSSSSSTGSATASPPDDPLAADPAAVRRSERPGRRARRRQMAHARAPGRLLRRERRARRARGEGPPRPVARPAA